MKTNTAFGGNDCVPETSIREYHPFLLKSSNLDSYVSKMRFDNILVGGFRGNKMFQELELCIVSSEYGCNAEIKSNCIYQNVDYKFRVNSPFRATSTLSTTRLTLSRTLRLPRA